MKLKVGDSFLNLDDNAVRTVTALDKTTISWFNTESKMSYTDNLSMFYSDYDRIIILSSLVKELM